MSKLFTKGSEIMNAIIVARILPKVATWRHILVQCMMVKKIIIVANVASHFLNLVITIFIIGKFDTVITVTQILHEIMLISREIVFENK